MVRGGRGGGRDDFRLGEARTRWNNASSHGTLGPAQSLPRSPWFGTPPVFDGLLAADGLAEGRVEMLSKPADGHVVEDLCAEEVLPSQRSAARQMSEPSAQLMNSLPLADAMPSKIGTEASVNSCITFPSVLESTRSLVPFFPS